ncbi:MAG: ATP-binding protein [Pseudanabaena sp. ELA607]|jgi:serine/threonine-protein kinase
MSDKLEMLKEILSKKLPPEQVESLMSELAIAFGNGSVAIAGDATEAVILTGNQNVLGNNNQVVINQSINTEDLVIMLGNLLARKNVPTQFQSLITDKIEGFVGREYVFDAIEAFISNNPKGYFTIIGDPGQGKSAILAKYVLDTGCIAHFNQLLQGPNRADQFLESVCRQLIERYQLPYAHLPPNTKQDGEFLGQLLDEVTQLRKGEKIIIAVDALDEVDTNSYRDASNILYLPAYLPDGVYFVLTCRRDVEVVPLTSFVPMQSLSLLDYQTDSQRDVRTYIGNRVDSSENLRQCVDVRGESITEFTDKIASKSENNFMYLRYVLVDIESGLYQDLTLEQFPQGLQGYYDFHWRRMGMMDKPLPVTKIKVVYVLAELLQPVSIRKICDFSLEDGITVERVIKDWKQFLHVFLKNSENYYSIYHSSFKDFLHRKDILASHPVTLKDVHKRIANNELKVWGKLKEFLRGKGSE